MTLEINSVFLHVRELLKIAGVQKTSPAYRVNSYVNVGLYTDNWFVFVRVDYFALFW